MFGGRGREFGSRGKGNRRSPVSHGSRHTRAASEWRKQAMHAVAEPAALEEPLASLPCRGPYWERPKHLIYRLDQEMARAGIAYYPEYGGRWRGFTIYVTAADKEKVRDMITRLVGRPGG
jgi:hypothetical protein